MINIRLIIIAIFLSSINFSVQAESLGTVVSAERKVTAPVNDLLHFGNMNGVKIAIPPKYWASAEVQRKVDTDACKDSSSSNRFNCSIMRIHLWLRRSTFEPIYTEWDLRNWAANFMRPYLKTDPANRWFGVRYRADLFESTQGNLRALYQAHFNEAVKHFGALSCNEKYGLTHCATEKADGPLLVNEFFFDTKTSQTLIECTKEAPTAYGQYYGCQQYFVVPEMKAVAQLLATSDEENSQWQPLSIAIKIIAISLISK
jgi:hypothetical protein